MKTFLFLIFIIYAVDIHAQSTQDSIVYGVLSFGTSGITNDYTKISSDIYFSDGRGSTTLSKDFKYVPEALNYLSHLGWRVITNAAVFEPNNNTSGFVWTTYTLEKVIKK